MAINKSTEATETCNIGISQNRQATWGPPPQGPPTKGSGGRSMREGWPCSSRAVPGAGAQWSRHYRPAADGQTRDGLVRHVPRAPSLIAGPQVKSAPI